MNYKITDFDKLKKTVSITVTWDDGSTYDKRMMCDLSSEETIRATIEEWLAEYAPMREAELNAYDPSELVDSKVDVSVKQLQDIKSGVLQSTLSTPVKGGKINA